MGDEGCHQVMIINFFENDLETEENLAMKD
jgi:hypothetical protein